MAERAAIESLDALTRLRAALCGLADDAGIALAEADAEILRTASWLREDQRLHWKREVERQTELCTRARSALKRKEAMKTPLGGRYSTVEEEKVLARAQRRLEEVRQRQANVRRWSRLLDDEAFAYKSVAQSLGHLIEAEIPKALARLDRMIAALEAYASGSAAPEQVRSAAPDAPGGVAQAQADSVRRTLPAAGDLSDVCRALRRRAASAAQRKAALAVPGAAAELAARPALDETARRTLAGWLGQAEAKAPSPGEQVIIARGAGAARRVWLFRATPAEPGDSGWQIGVADDDAEAAPGACRVADVVAARPEWEILLRFPPGWLVLIDGGTVAAVLRPDATPGAAHEGARP